jgi:hypothetical protein
MDRELERYHTSNAAMDLLIGDLRGKLDAMQAAAAAQRSAVKQGRALEAACKADLYECVQHIQVGARGWTRARLKPAPVSGHASFVRVCSSPRR